jgi:hypothetical protein
MTTFRILPVYTLQQVSPYLGGLWEVAKDGQPKFRSCEETCREWLNKWAGGRFTEISSEVPYATAYEERHNG